MGTLENVSHLDLVGWINTARYKWAAMTGREIKFRPATFYLGIADMLAEKVENQPPIDNDRGPSPGGSGNKAGQGVNIQREDSKASDVQRGPSNSRQMSTKAVRPPLSNVLQNGVTMTTGEDIANVTGEEGGTPPSRPTQ